jgi:LysM repeat protein
LKNDDQSQLEIDKLIASLESSTGAETASDTFDSIQSVSGIVPKTEKTGGDTESSGNYYIVVEGDTLGKIASMTGVSIDEIRKKNRLDKDVVKLGQKLIIPGKSNYKVYRVTKGDTLNKIATLFHTTPEKLTKINDISDPRKLKTGMEIKVPKE